MEDTWGHLEETFFELLKLGPEEREQRLGTIKPSEAKALREMLFHHHEADKDRFLELEQPGPVTVPKAFGSYDVIRELGSGGMGRVYLAERSDGHYKQVVAVKQLNHAIASEGVLARFRIERQLLARFQHPNIGKLIDGGIDDFHMPYLVMEYIKGIDIISYCEKNACTLDDRLELYTQVCRAVQYAHQNLVVHRDLKPTNILVTDEGQVKLLDFGIAKILESDSGDLTGTKDATPMTPRYSSPEQILGESITTACDIYALGILLFELLTGDLPFGKQSSIHSLHYAILEKTPNQPSERFIALLRGLEGHRAKDIDAICLKCLQRLPERRYQTVSNLIEDLQRFRNFLPVSAKGDSSWYKLSKFLYRHKLFVATSTLFALLLFLAAAGLVIQSHKIKKESERVFKQTRRSEAIAGFLENLFLEADPEIALGSKATAKDLLNRGVERIDSLQSSQPDLHDALTQVLSKVHLHLGDYDQALSLIRKIHLTNELSTVDRIKVDQMMGAIFLGKGKLIEAEEHLLKAESQAASLEISPQINMSIQLSLGDLYSRFTKDEKADEAYNRALSFAQESIDDEKGDMGILRVQSQIARHEADKLNWDRAIEMHRKILNQKQTLWPSDHPGVGVSHGNLANVLRWKRQFQESQKHFIKSIENLEHAYPDGHMLIATTKNNYAGLLKDMDLPDEAQKNYEHSLEILVSLYGENHPRVIMAENNMAVFFAGIQRYERASELFTVVIKKAGELLPESHPFPYQVRSSYGVLLQKAGKNDQAEMQFRGLMRDLSEASKKHMSLIIHLSKSEVALARFLMNTQRETEAIPFFERGLDRLRKQVGVFHPNLAYPLFSYSRCLIESGQYEKAKEIASETLEVHRLRGAEPLNQSVCKAYLGISLLNLGQQEESKVLLMEAFSELESGLGLEYKETQQALKALETLSRLQGDQETLSTLTEKKRSESLKTYSHR